MSLASTNTGITDTDRSDVLLATTGDTLTLFFETSERIGTPEDGALAPEIEIHDNDSNKIGIGTVSVQSTDAGAERLWKAEFTVPDEEAFSNYEMDLGFQISVKDPSGNPRVIGFDELGTLIDETGPRPLRPLLMEQESTPSHPKSSSCRLRQATRDSRIRIG